MTRLLPYSFAKRYGVQLYGELEGIPLIAHKNKPSIQTIQELRRILGQKFHFKPLSEGEFNALLAASHESNASAAMETLQEDDLSLAAEQLAEPEDLLEAQDDAPIIRLINALLTEAIKENASDIHMEVFENSMVVRFRVDGVLREVLRPPRSVAAVIISRIKVMAKLDIAEKRQSQDGRISLRIAGHAVDVRVSILPTGYGERAVLRLLDKQAGRLNLENLGMYKNDHDILESIIKKPNGIILVTGPTGSGKTTTLYAILNRLNQPERNILTVEDPIEYYLDGIGQTQVNSKVNMSFARGLRAMLRQDPDVVMVGEIRDIETAEIAVQASLTGHLVLSTLHTNSAIGAVTRLRDMGVEPFLLASSLIGLIAQRLVRTFNPECKKPHPATSKEYEMLTKCGLLAQNADNPMLYLPDESCSSHAFKGRTGIYEIIAIDGKLREMIHEGSSEYEMETYVRQFRPSLREDGFRRALRGDTSLEEVLRATREDS